ncbi:MAG: hypothetical protein P1V97_19650 [Planctomycetota bacterium]|nr:hypothetical protein [Planctomycetota bacterium]
MKKVQLIALMTLALSSCSDSSSSRTPRSLPVPGGIAPVAGFPSQVTMTVSSRNTARTLSLLSVDQSTGELGLLPGFPLDVGAPVGDAETLAVDAFNRRVYLASNINGMIAGSNIDLAGRATPIAGSPFASEGAAPTVLSLGANRDVLYVGYENENFISLLSVNPTTGVVGAPISPPLVINGNFIETMKQLGDLLYVFCRNTSNILCLRIEPNGTLTTLPVNVSLPSRPDFADFIGNRLYVSTAGSELEGFDLDPSTGDLTRIQGSPWVFPRLDRYELIRAHPSGDFIAVGAEDPANVGLIAVDSVDGSLSLVNVLGLTPNVGGPEGIFWEPSGRFLYVNDHIGEGIFVFELVNGRLQPAATPRYRLPGGQIDMDISAMTVTPP